MLFEHQTVNDSESAYANAIEHANGIESRWATLKRAHKGTYHKLSAKHLQRYMNEFLSQHDDRCAGTIEIIQHPAQGMDGNQVPFNKRIAQNGLPNGARSSPQPRQIVARCPA